MEKSLDIALRQQMNVDEMPGLGDIPALGTRAQQLIAKRKKETVLESAPAKVSFLDLLFGKYRLTTLSFSVIGLVFTMNFICTFNIDQQTGNIAATETDTSLTVSSNTYLATLNQSTINEVPANTSTALTCISTFKN
jgi:hypothetical protein